MDDSFCTTERKLTEKLFIYGARSQKSQNLLPALEKAAREAGLSIVRTPAEADMAVCVGGDGTLLRMLREHSFPELPIAGINTGHLGFFQEFSDSEPGSFIELIKSGGYSIQKHRLVEARVRSGGGERVYRALNDIVIRRNASGIVHLRLYVGESFVEQFSGDGLVISSAAGSTAYNYSVGGGIVDPRAELLQIAPIAPMNTASYRSLSSGIIIPPQCDFIVTPEGRTLSKALVVADGNSNPVEDLERIAVSLSGQCVSIVRRGDYDFWGKVKDKFSL